MLEKERRLKAWPAQILGNTKGFKADPCPHDQADLSKNNVRDRRIVVRKKEYY